MKHFLFLILIITTPVLYAQENRQYDRHLDPNDSLMLVNLPELKLPDAYKSLKSKDLPDYHNNSENEFFRPIFNQYGWSCGQASTIGYNFTYEMNRFNNTPADLEDNQYPPIFAFNFFNRGEDGVGVCYLYTLEALKRNGTPNVTDYGGMGESLTHWANGYDIYYNGMSNRIDEIYSLHVGDEEGLLILKQYLYDHLDGSATGGIVNFYTDLYSYTSLPAGTPEEGKSVITEFGPYTGHSMTFIGWNDSIRWDYNGDGQYTNDIDINGDGDVTMKDWEIGGVILANSWGDDWADSGFCYVMYNVLAKEKMEGGIWNKQVNIFTIKENYEPRLTYKVKLTHDSRNKIKVIAGVSADTSVSLPQHLLEFPVFNYQGGNNYMQGFNYSNDYKTLEFGLDVTPLLSYVTPGEPARFFFQVHEQDPGQAGTGSINGFSLMDYTAGTLEVECAESEVPLNENSSTTLSLVHTLNWDDVGILNEDLQAFIPGQPYSAQMDASGGTEPYRWEIAPVYSNSRHEADYPSTGGQQIYPNNNQTGFAIQVIDFQFPFFDRFTDTVYMHVDGFLKFDESPYPLPYQVEDMLIFKNEAIVAALLNKDMLINVSGGNKLWYEGDADHAAFRWQTEIPYGNNTYPVDVTATLYPDGRIEIHQDVYAFPGQVQAITGISNGDAINYLMEDPLFIEELTSPVAYTYSPLNYPAETTISPDGLMSFTPLDDNKIYTVTVRVTDNHNITDQKNFQLSSGIIYEYTIQSGNNNQIDYGETSFIDFILKNNGGIPLNNLVLTVSTDDPYVDWIDNSEDIEVLVPGETADLSGTIALTMNSIYPDGHNFTVDVLISADEGEWESRINLTAHAPGLITGTPVVDDGENGRLDPGETVDVIIPMMNTGFATAEGVEVSIATDDPYIIINNGNLSFGDIQGGGVAYDAMNLTVAEDAPQGHESAFFLTITAQPDLALTDSLQMLIGRYPVFVADLDPELLSGPFIKTALEQLDVAHAYDYIIPNNLDYYQNIFVVLGRNFGQHILTQAEGQKLADFLNNGGNIYMEGGLTWYDDPETPVHPMFNLEAEYVSWTAIDSVIGNEGTFLDSLSFEYDGDVNYYNNHLQPKAGTGAYAVLHSSEEAHNFAVAFADENYKTVGSILDFGGILDGPVPSTKYHLLGKILEFFEVDVIITGLEDLPDKEIAGEVSFHPNPVKDDFQLHFSLEENQPVTVSIYDVQGNKVATLLDHANMKAGIHDLKGSLSGLPPAVYICTVRTATATNSLKMIKTE